MFIKTIHKSGIQTFGLLLAIAGAGAALLAWPEAVATGVSPGAVHLLVGDNSLAVSVPGAGRLSGPFRRQPNPWAAAGKADA